MKNQHRNLVIVLIALWAVVQVLYLTCDDSFWYSYGDDTKEDSVLHSTQTLQQAVRNYRGKIGAYPTTLDDLVTPPHGGRPFIDGGPSALLDPWGKRYDYVYQPEGGFAVWTVDPQGKRIQWTRNPY